MPLPKYISVSKGIFTTTVLRDLDQIVAFSAFLNAGTTIANAVKFAWDNSNDVELDSPFVSGLVSSLVPSVLSQACEDRRQALIAELAPPAPSAPVPENPWYIEQPTKDLLEAWLAANTGGVPYTIADGGVIETGVWVRLTTTATLPAPAVNEGVL